MPLILKELTTNAAPQVNTHPDATSANAGFMTTAFVNKLNAIENNANLYNHPSGDGNLHIPATSTTNNNKFLKAGSTPGSLSWSDIAISMISGLQDALNSKAPTANPTLTGNTTIKNLTLDAIETIPGTLIPTCASLGITQEGALRIINHQLYISINE